MPWNPWLSTNISTPKGQSGALLLGWLAVPPCCPVWFGRILAPDWSSSQMQLSYWSLKGGEQQAGMGAPAGLRNEAQRFFLLRRSSSNHFYFLLQLHHESSMIIPSSLFSQCQKRPRLWNAHGSLINKTFWVGIIFLIVTSLPLRMVESNDHYFLLSFLSCSLFDFFHTLTGGVFVRSQYKTTYFVKLCGCSLSIDLTTTQQ